MYKKAVFVLIALVSILSSAVAQEEKKGARYIDYKSKVSSTNPGDLLREAQELKASNPAAALDKVQEALGVSLAGK
ncbi:MAG TPA: hypothetical protein VGD31_12635, partial [Sphingobacteriaceae bacterium]